MDLACGNIGEEPCQGWIQGRAHRGHKRFLPLLPQEGKCCSGLTQPKDKKKHIDHMFTPLIFVLYTVVQCIVGCILYNKQIVWP